MKLFIGGDITPTQITSPVFDRGDLDALFGTVPTLTRTGDAFVAVSDVHWSCGGGFVRQVSPVADPANRTVTLGENECSGKIWYVFDN